MIQNLLRGQIDEVNFVGSKIDHVCCLCILFGWKSCFYFSLDFSQENVVHYFFTLCKYYLAPFSKKSKHATLLQTLCYNNWNKFCKIKLTHNSILEIKVHTKNVKKTHIYILQWLPLFLTSMQLGLKSKPTCPRENTSKIIVSLAFVKNNFISC